MGIKNTIKSFFSTDNLIDAGNRGIQQSTNQAAQNQYNAFVNQAKHQYTITDPGHSHSIQNQGLNQTLASQYQSYNQLLNQYGIAQNQLNQLANSQQMSGSALGNPYQYQNVYDQTMKEYDFKKNQMNKKTKSFENGFDGWAYRDYTTNIDLEEARRSIAKVAFITGVRNKDAESFILQDEKLGQYYEERFQLEEDEVFQKAKMNAILRRK